jgi:osmoprotectant transport system permease protein
MRLIRITVCLLLFCLSIGAALAEPPLIVGSKRFTESYILAEIVRQTATAVSGATAVHKQGLGNTGIVFSALQNGDIDLYPEYTGTISHDLLKLSGPQTLAQLNQGLAPMHLAASVPLGFNDTYALTMRADEAQALHIRSISDLAAHPDLKLGLSAEFLKRQDGWPGLKAAYNLPFEAPEGMDHGVAYTALAQKQIDVTDAYSTDAAIEKYHLVVLQDDRHYFPEYDAVLLYRDDVPSMHPKAWAAIEKLQNRISADQMIHMNADADLHGESYAAIAAAFLSGSISSETATREPSLWDKIFAPDFWPLTGQHVFLVFASLAASILIAVPLGILAFERRRSAGAIFSVTGVIQTIPSLALFVFLIPLFHIGNGSALVALFLYSLLPIVRNTYTGLQDIAPSLRESAEALGLDYGTRLRQIELPIAARSILAGIKTAAVINVGTATIAAFVGAGGYGQRISEGLANDDMPTMLSGAIPAAALALIVQGGFDLLERVVVPKGLRVVKR